MSTEPNKTLKLKYEIPLLSYTHNKFNYASHHIESIVYSQLEYKDGIISYKRSITVISPVPYLIAKVISLPSKMVITETGTITSNKIEYESKMDSHPVVEKVVMTADGKCTDINIEVSGLPKSGLISTLNGIYVKERIKALEDDSVTDGTANYTLDNIYASMLSKQ